MHLKLSILWIILWLTSPVAEAQRTKAAAPDQDFHLYVLMGQSNMAGRGAITEAFQSEGHPRVLMLNKDREWVPARHPVHFDKPTVAGVGPGLAFAIQMAEANPNLKIGLVPCAVGGTAIASWQPGGHDAATNTHPYDDAVARIRVASQAGPVKGMLWHQGESDSSPQMTAAYLPKLAALIERVRTLVGDPALPVVAGELGHYKDYYQNINRQLTQLRVRVPHTAVASAQGLGHKGDGTHFDAASAQILGQRFAEKMKELQRQRR